MTTKLTPQRYGWIILVALLAGCGPGATPIAPTEVNLTAIHIRAGGTAAVELTQIASIRPIATIIPTNLPTETPDKPFVLDGLRVAYIIDGNIYVQDSGRQPVQLTHSGEDRSPMFSDDGERIVFFRGAVEEQYRFYAINADGSQEQALVTGSILKTLGLGYDESTEIDSRYFMPGTHQLLFDTQQFKPTTGELFYSYHPNAKWNSDLLAVNIDSAEFKRLQDPGKGGLFQVSPDGKLMTDSRNIFRINGDLVRSNLITYLPNWENEGINLNWTHDSSKLIMLPPIKGDADPTDGPEPRTIWQYPIDGSSAIEIRLNPPPMTDFSVSPDENWIVYDYFYYPGKTDEASPDGVYVGNLRDGSSHLVESGRSYGLPYSFDWSPDSQHFIFSTNIGEIELYLGNTQGDITPLNATEFLGWIDSNRYLYEKDDVVIREVGKAEGVRVVDLPVSLKNLNAAYFTYVFKKPDVKK